MSTTDLILRIIVALFLLYIPFLCYLDLRYREIPYGVWFAMALVGVPLTAWMYITEQYPIISLLVSIVAVATFYFMMFHDLLQGADFMFLFFISMFWVINPYPVPHGLMQITFYIYLLVVMLLTAPVLLLYNYRKGHRWGGLNGVVDMMSVYPGGLPFIIPISIAFILSLVMG